MKVMIEYQDGDIEIIDEVKRVSFVLLANYVKMRVGDRNEWLEVKAEGASRIEVDGTTIYANGGANN